ncbi:unnamed protein product [Calypogeia fissa]
METFLSPEFRGDLGSGILDLHSIDDSMLFSEASMSEPFHSPPTYIPAMDENFELEFDSSFNYGKQQNKPRLVAENSPVRSSTIEKERGGRDNNIARIKVVVRKRPVNKKELSRKEEDIVSIADDSCSVTVHEPKLKVDLTAYVEKHEFFFDAVLDDHVSNNEVYNVTVEPIVPAIFQRTKATCFAYGQTGSGKTYTMQPLPLRASEDILALMQQPAYKQEGFQLWLSFFEIYGGKLYDLLNERRKLCMREDGRQQVCIVGLQEYRVSDVQLVREYIDKGNGSRSTGSTGANEESSRSHAILQLVIKKAQDGCDTRAGRAVGKLSFIDLAGSERGADTTDNDRQTRMEGAEINKSLLALKECIRALDNDQGHIPFRGSKLTEVLRDSFMGDSRTVMISCISPNTGSCEHTLNTLRYADRVKGLSRSNNTKRETVTVQMSSSQRETNISPPPVPFAQPIPQVPEHQQQIKTPDRFLWNSLLAEREGFSEYGFQGREESNRLTSISIDKDRISLKDNSVDSGLGNLRDLLSAPGGTTESQEQEKHQLVLPSRRKVAREEKFDRSFSIDRNSSSDRNSATDRNASLDRNLLGDRSLHMDRSSGQAKEEAPRFDGTNGTQRRHNLREDLSLTSSQFALKENDSELDSLQTGYDGHINAILEEEEEVISAHRKEVEDTMEIVREEMKLLAEVDRPGSRIDRYVSQLNYVLSRKAAGIVNLQARLTRFQRHLKEQEILSRTSGRQP